MRNWFPWGDPRAPARLWLKIAPCPMSGCWLWTGSATRGGYGYTTRPGPPRTKIADLDERIRLLRAASRPSEPLDEGRGGWQQTAQGHILSALTQLEKRRALLQGSNR